MNGCGELPIGGEAKRLLPQIIARQAHPLLVKASPSIRMPIYFLGGCIQELWKMKGDQSVITSYRDITLADLDGKVFGSFVRAAIFSAVSMLAGKAQLGAGFNGGATDICHLGVTQAFACARVKAL